MRSGYVGKKVRHPFYIVVMEEEEEEMFERRRELLLGREREREKE